MAIPNVNQITATLRTMGDAQLQQYAAMHKDDPYILPMAIAESNARKQMRLQMQAKNMGQPQPKVVDQEIAQMTAPPQGGALPEDQGIARLPTPNMQHMAGGGIVAFADGGYTDEEMMDSNTPVMRMADGGPIKKYAGKAESLVRTTTGGKSWFLDVPKTIRDPSVAWYREIPNPLAALADQEFPSRDAAIQAYNAAAPDTSASTPAATPTAAATPIVPYGQSKAVDMSGTPPPPPPPPAAQQGLGSISVPKTLTAEEAKKQAGIFSNFDETRAALKQAKKDQETEGASMRTALSEGLPKTPVMEGLSKLLDKQEAETGGEKEKAGGLALLTAGLAVAGGSSKFALQNLKEAIPAVTQYSDALKDFKKMERENMKLRGDIEVAQRAESTNNLKLKLDVESKISDRRDKINELGIQLTSKIADVDTRTATDIWKTSQDNASRIQSAVAGAQASTQGQLGFLSALGAADPNSSLAKGYKMSKQEGAEPRLYTEYIKLTQDPVNGAAFLSKYPTFDTFKEGYGGAGMQFASPPPTASILKPPKA